MNEALPAIVVLSLRELCCCLVSQLKSRLAQLDINTMKQINENLKPSDSVRSQAMFD